VSWDWLDTPGDEPEAVSRALPVLGIATGLDTPFPCVLPDCAYASHLARVSSRDLYYRCPDHPRELRLVDVYAACSMQRSPCPMSHSLAVAWWGRLWIEAGVLAVDLPCVTLDDGCPNRRRVGKVLRGLVLLQAIRTRGGTKRPMPSDFARDFAAAWCHVSRPAAWRSLETLADRGYVTREKVSPVKGHASWRYQLTGKGLKIERRAHEMILPAPTLQAAA
jgi:hypothetical protein